MSRDETAAVLHIEVTLDARLEKIAGLAYDGKDGGQQRCKSGPLRPKGKRHTGAEQSGADHAADQTGPGFFRADAGSQLRATDGPPGGIGTDVGRPNGEQQINEEPQPVFVYSANPKQGDASEDDVRDAESEEPAMLRTPDRRRGEQ